MKVLAIAGKEYKVEYTMEASLCEDCTQRVTGLMVKIGMAEDTEAIEQMVESFSDIPQTTLSMFYAGLLEHHGPDGDGSVMTKSDAKKLIKQYFQEHKEEKSGNFYGMLEMLLEQMRDDGFFKQIGLEQIMAPTE